MVRRKAVEELFQQKPEEERVSIRKNSIWSRALQDKDEESLNCLMIWKAFALQKIIF